MHQKANVRAICGQYLNIGWVVTPFSIEIVFCKLVLKLWSALLSVLHPIYRTVRWVDVLSYFGYISVFVVRNRKSLASMAYPFGWPLGWSTTLTLRYAIALVVPKPILCAQTHTHTTQRLYNWIIIHSKGFTRKRCKQFTVR